MIVWRALSHCFVLRAGGRSASTAIHHLGAPLSLPLRPSGRPRVKLKKRAERRGLSITWPRRRLGRRKRRSLDERVRRPSVLRGGRGLRAGATWAAARVKRRGGQAETAELAQRAARWTPPACLPESRLAASAPAAQLTLQMGDRTEEPGLLAARLVAAGWLAGWRKREASYLQARGVRARSPFTESTQTLT